MATYGYDAKLDDTHHRYFLMRRSGNGAFLLFIWTCQTCCLFWSCK